MPQAKHGPAMTLVSSMAEIPVFASEDEEHLFWETHELADELCDDLPSVPEEELPRPRTKPVPVRFDEDVLRRVKALAAKRHTGYQTLLKQFVVERLYEEEKRRIERNMLALSNLNLATSSFVGGEIQRMLSQALDRVLGVVRLPAGALFLHHGDPQGPTSVVAVGLSDEFCRATQNESLDDYLVSLGAQRRPDDAAVLMAARAGR